MYILKFLSKNSETNEKRWKQLEVMTHWRNLRNRTWMMRKIAITAAKKKELNQIPEINYNNSTQMEMVQI